MSEQDGQQQAPEGDNTPPEGGGGTEGETKQQEQTFTQADVDRIVKERVQRERAKFADHDDLKAKAGRATTLEERLSSLETELTTERTKTLRATVAAEYGISTKAGENGAPSDADLFLTGTDEDTLKAQAERLSARESDRKKQSNFVPREGNPPRPGAGSTWGPVLQELDSRRQT